MTRPPPSEVTWMVRFTSGETVPLAVTCVGSARVSAFAVLNNSGLIGVEDVGIDGDRRLAGGGRSVFRAGHGDAKGGQQQH